LRYGLPAAPPAKQGGSSALGNNRAGSASSSLLRACGIVFRQPRGAQGLDDALALLQKDRIVTLRAGAKDSQGEFRIELERDLGLLARFLRPPEQLQRRRQVEVRDRIIAI